MDESAVPAEIETAVVRELREASTMSSISSVLNERTKSSPILPRRDTTGSLALSSRTRVKVTDILKDPLLR